MLRQFVLSMAVLSLQPMAKDSLTGAWEMSGGSADILFRSPITWVFWALTGITVAALIRRGLKGRGSPVG